MPTDQPHLRPRAANHRPLSPLDAFARAVQMWPDRPAILWRDQGWTYAQMAALVARMAARLRAAGIGRGDVVSVLLVNRPEMLAAHFAVPLLGAILNTINTRLDAQVIATILTHSGSRVLLAEADTLPLARDAAGAVAVVALADPGGPGDWALLDSHDDPGLPDDLLAHIDDEWQPICLNYTSGTTGAPKGVVYHHRGAALNALGNVLAMGFGARSVYLWTLPMFHCNGWCHSWAVTAAGGTHVCLDKVDPAAVFDAIARHGVTHMACAPVVLYMLLNHPDRASRAGRTARVRVGSGGASPSLALITQMDAVGFDFVHLYGLTESFGPATLCDGLDAPDLDTRAALLARQGRRHATASQVSVRLPDGRPVPADGQTMGEITLRGNTLMAGYWHDSDATDRAFAGGVFHTGDLAVMHPNGDIEIRDRAKDIIISGGENISSLEIENVLHRHPAVLLAAVVAAPDAKWGEVPCAFIEPKPGADADPDTLRAFCRAHLAPFKVPRRYIFGPLPRTATGKIQKFLLRQRAQGLPGDDHAG